VCSSDLIKQSRGDAAAYEAFLKKAEELVKRMAKKEAVAGVPAALHGNPEAIVLFNNLPSILTPGLLSDSAPEMVQVRVDLALDIDRAMREHAPAGWKGDETREKQVLNALFPIMSRDRVATLALFDIVKHQSGY
jgi:type I restriction enzyme R subunit